MGARLTAKTGDLKLRVCVLLGIGKERINIVLDHINWEQIAFAAAVRNGVGVTAWSTAGSFLSAVYTSCECRRILVMRARQIGAET